MMGLPMRRWGPWWRLIRARRDDGTQLSPVTGRIRACKDDGVAVDAFAALVPPRFIRVRKDDGGRWVTNIIRKDGDHS